MTLLLAFLLALPAPEEPAPARELRTYDIRFLTEDVPQFPAAIWPSAGRPELDQGDEEGVPIAFSSFGEDESGAAWTPEGQGVPPDRLVALIRQNIAEDSWANENNSIGADQSELVVVQRPVVHAEIEALLTALRARRASLVAVDVVLVPTRRLPKEALESAWLTQAVFEEAGSKAGADGFQLSLTAYNEQRKSVFRGQHETALTDIEVNQTGVIPVPNPVVTKRRLGVSIEVFPTSIAGTDLYRLELRIVRLRKAGRAIFKPTLYGKLEFQPLDESSLSTTLLLAKQRPGVAGHFRALGLDGKEREFAVLVQVRPLQIFDSTEAKPTTDEEFTLRVHDVRLLTQARKGSRPPFSAELLAALVRHNVDADAWRDDRAKVENEKGSLRVLAQRETHQRVRVFLDALFANHAHVVTVDVREYEGPLQALLELQERAGNGVFLPAASSDPRVPESMRLVFHGATVGLVGEPCEARGVEARGFLSNAFSISGGTGFAIVEVPDPDVASAGSGFTLWTRVKPLERADHFAVEVDLARLHATFDRTVEVRFPGWRSTGGSAGKVEKAVRPAVDAELPTLPFVLDLPAQERRVTRTLTRLPAGRSAILQAEDVGGGRGRLVIASVGVRGLLERGK